MPFVYRYIDISEDQPKVVYVGKVCRNREEPFEALLARHKEHVLNDDWYKEIGGENLTLEYIEVPSSADADILESYYIAKLDSDGLKNKAKRWGKTHLQIENQFVWKGLAEEFQKKYVELTRDLVEVATDVATGKRAPDMKLAFVSTQFSKESLYYLDELDKAKHLRNLMTNATAQNHFREQYPFM